MNGDYSPVSVSVDRIFEVLDAALGEAVATHGDGAKAFAWDVNAHFRKELGMWRRP